jgi:outer membrane protein
MRSRFRRNVLFLALLSSAAGAAETNVPGVFQRVDPNRTAVVPTAVYDGNSIAVADLIEVYELARVNDPLLALVESNSLAIGEGVAQARSFLLPQVAGDYSWQNTDSDGSSQQFVDDPVPGFETFAFSSDIDDKGWGAQLTQSIFSWTNWKNLAASRETALAGQFDYEAAADNLLQRSANVYFGVLRAKDNLAFAMADEAALKRQLEQAEQRFEVGLSAITDVEEARARYDAARATTISARNVLDDAKVAVAELTGKAITELKPVKEELPLDPPQPADAAEWLQMADRSSPVILSDQATVRAAQENIQAARSGHYPTVDGFVNYQDGSSNGTRALEGFESPIDSEAQTTVYGLRVTVPLFTGGRTSSLTRQAIYQRDAAGNLLEQDRRAVLRSTVNSYRSAVAGVSSVQARAQALRSAQAALEATQAGFEVGTRTIVDVLIAQQALTQAYSLYSGARYDFILNSLALRTFAGVIERSDLELVNAQLDDNVPTVEELATRALPEQRSILDPIEESRSVEEELQEPDND